MASKRLGRVLGHYAPDDLSFKMPPSESNVRKAELFSLPCGRGYTRPKMALPNVTSDALEAIEKRVPAGRVVARIVTVLFALALIGGLLLLIIGSGKALLGYLPTSFPVRVGNARLRELGDRHRNLRIDVCIRSTQAQSSYDA